jgi:hypothetical protein
MNSKFSNAIKWEWIAIAFILALPAHAYIYMVAGVQRLSTSLTAARVVYGVINHVASSKPEPPTMDGPGPATTATFHVERVLMDHRSLNRDYSSVQFKPETPNEIQIVYHPDLEDWPSILVPVKEGQHCILVCGPAGEVRTALPARAAIEQASDLDEVKLKHLLADVMSKQLLHEANPDRQQRIIACIADVVSPSEAVAILAPLLKANDAKVRRAALAGLAYATSDPKYIKQAVVDIGAALKTIGNPTAFSPQRQQLFQCYFYLNSYGYGDREDGAKLTPLLPLYRLLLDNGDLDRGLGPISLFGSKDDLERLYRYHNHHETRYRQMVISGISRILNLGLPNYTEPDFLAHEAEFQWWVKEAIHPGAYPSLNPRDPRLNRFEDCYFNYNDYCYTEHPNMAQNPAFVVARLMAGYKPSEVPIGYKYPGRNMNAHYCRAQAELNKGLLFENAAVNLKMLGHDQARYESLHKDAIDCARVALEELEKFSQEQKKTDPDPNLGKCYALAGKEDEAVKASLSLMKTYIPDCTVNTLLAEGKLDGAKTLLLHYLDTNPSGSWAKTIVAADRVILAHIARLKHDETAYKSYRLQALRSLSEVSIKDLEQVWKHLGRMNIDTSPYRTSY